MLLSINQGVQQGLILGPLIFSFYIYDLTTLLNPGHVVLCADDSAVFFRDKDLAFLVHVINSKLIDLGKWLCFNHLHLSVNKCHYMLFSGKRPVCTFDLIFGSSKRPVSTFDLIFGSSVLQHVHNTKFLGLFIDENLIWDVHINYICRKISRSVGIINLLKSYVHESVLISEYHALVSSHIQYC